MWPFKNWDKTPTKSPERGGAARHEGAAVAEQPRVKSPAVRNSPRVVAPALIKNIVDLRISGGNLEQVAGTVQTKWPMRNVQSQDTTQESMPVWMDVVGPLADRAKQVLALKLVDRNVNFVPKPTVMVYLYDDWAVKCQQYISQGCGVAMTGPSSLVVENADDPMENGRYCICVHDSTTAGAEPEDTIIYIENDDNEMITIDGATKALPGKRQANGARLKYPPGGPSRTVRPKNAPPSSGSVHVHADANNGEGGSSSHATNMHNNNTNTGRGREPPAKRLRVDAAPKYNYTLLNALAASQEAKQTPIHVYGVIGRFSHESKTARPDNIVVVHMISPEMPDPHKAVSINIFSSKKLPGPMLVVGDIIRLHRCTVDRYFEGKTSLVSSASKHSEWVIFRHTDLYNAIVPGARVATPDSRRSNQRANIWQLFPRDDWIVDTSSENVTLEEQDLKIVTDLWRWFSRNAHTMTFCWPQTPDEEMRRISTEANRSEGGGKPATQPPIIVESKVYLLLGVDATVPDKPILQVWSPGVSPTHPHTGQHQNIITAALRLAGATTAFDGSGRIRQLAASTAPLKQAIQTLFNGGYLRSGMWLIYHRQRTFKNGNADDREQMDPVPPWIKDVKEIASGFSRHETATSVSMNIQQGSSNINNAAGGSNSNAQSSTNDHTDADTNGLTGLNTYGSLVDGRTHGENTYGKLDRNANSRAKINRYGFQEEFVGKVTSAHKHVNVGSGNNGHAAGGGVRQGGGQQNLYKKFTHMGQSLGDLLLGPVGTYPAARVYLEYFCPNSLDKLLSSGGPYDVLVKNDTGYLEASLSRKVINAAMGTSTMTRNSAMALLETVRKAIDKKIPVDVCLMSLTDRQGIRRFDVIKIDFSLVQNSPVQESP